MGLDGVELSAVVPLYRSVETIAELHCRLGAALQSLTDRYEIVFVDDGCPEGSGDRAGLLAQDDPHVGILRLGANRGQHGAVLAGLREARGDWAVILDADLQDPPEAIPALLRAARGRFDAVFAGRRGRYESWFRLLTSRLFKWALHLATGTPADAGLFVILSRRMVDRLVAFRGRAPFTQLLIARAGLPCSSVPVRREPSQGRSAYDVGGRLKLAASALRLAFLGDGRRSDGVGRSYEATTYLPPRGSLRSPARGETP